MSVMKFIQNQQIHPKSFIYICLGTMLLLGLLQLFMHFVVFPHQGGFMNLHIPSRSGGYDVQIETSQFMAIGSIVLVIGVLATTLVAGMIRLGKSGIATVITFLFLVSSITYLALYIGSAFSALWGDLWATLGVLIVIAIGMALELPLLAWMNQNLKKK